MQEIRGFRVKSDGSAGSRNPIERVISYGIRRCVVREYLLRRLRTGIREGSPISRLERSGEHWIINDAIKARMLVVWGTFLPCRTAHGQ